MTEADRTAAVAKLEATRDAFHQAVSGLSHEQARFKSSPERWSVEEIVEHVAVAEHGMFRFISEFHEISDHPHEAESAASLERTRDRKKMPLDAPERSQPKARYPNVGVALSQFIENRNRTIEFVKNCQDDLRLRIIKHPAGLVNGVDCLKILTGHPLRHVAQIDEVKADPAFPR
jgi:DinB superfamily